MQPLASERIDTKLTHISGINKLKHALAKAINKSCHYISNELINWSVDQPREAMIKPLNDQLYHYRMKETGHKNFDQLKPCLVPKKISTVPVTSNI